MGPSAEHGEPTRPMAQVPGAGDRPNRPGTHPKAVAQVELIERAYGGGIARGRQSRSEGGVPFLYRESHLLIRDEYLSQALGRLDGAVVIDPMVRGVSLVRVSGNAQAAIDQIRQDFGAGVAAPDHLVSITGEGFFCPATEPEVVPAWTQPDPKPTTDHAAGAGVRVVVVDTGLDPAAPGSVPWLTGVTGDPDPAITGGTLGPYAGHGTFIAGVIRSLAPQAEVIVRGVFTRAGASFESSLVTALDGVLSNDYPDVISMSAGTLTDDPAGSIALNVFYETRLSHHKGVAMIVAAGNNASRQPFWPAAAPWTLSVGALAANWRERASFSDFGGWVDVYAPGEDLVNAFPRGTYTYQEPPLPRPDGHFEGMARWDGTSFATPIVAAMVAARMSRTGENGRDAAAALLQQARSQTIPGVGAVLLPQ
jgi:hypothetical protein